MLPDTMFNQNQTAPQAMAATGNGETGLQQLAPHSSTNCNYVEN